MSNKPKSTEVDAYVFIKENLKMLGWDTRNPERFGGGQVYTQNECLANLEIKKHLGLDRPENVVKVTERVLWVVEAKRSHMQLNQALREAENYAQKLNKSNLLQVKFISGVAGNSFDSFLIRTLFFDGNYFVPVKINGIEVSSLLSPEQTEIILRTNNPNIENQHVDEKLFLSRAELINKILHLGAVNPHQRAAVMAALLLSTLSNTGVNVEERSPTVLIGDINSRVKSVLQSQKKDEFYDYIKISLPTTPDNHVKFRKALVDTLQQLNGLNIRSAMNSGDDWLGAFYEVFLKYANWAQDLGIVLTPRHITRFIAEVMEIQHHDIVYDPTCGTGGFLVAALDYVKQTSNVNQLARFKQYSVFGIEQDSGVAALAVVNMIFRGDGKNNIQEGNCFSKFLAQHVEKGVVTAKYTDVPSVEPPVTKVMMNPPFALKNSDEKEFRFVDQALRQMQDGGLLFTILPYSAMVRPGTYLNWRKNSLLTHHTLLSVITFPNDLFYPVGVIPVGVFIRKGVPHPRDQKVLWIRALNDGLLKSKGKRLPNSKASNDLLKVKDLQKAFIRNPNYAVETIQQFQQAIPIDFDDNLLELVPENYLEQTLPTRDEIRLGLEQTMRDAIAFLIKARREGTNQVPSLNMATEIVTHKPMQRDRLDILWGKFSILQIFDIKRGDFHSIADLDPGNYMTISRVSTDNGVVGYFDKPDKANAYPRGYVTVSTVSGDAFVQLDDFIATDNVVVCKPKQRFQPATLFFLAFMINHQKWRYSYGRQCYTAKLAKMNLDLPITDKGEIDEELILRMIQHASYWDVVLARFSER